jgi:hypothetical protein
MSENIIISVEAAKVPSRVITNNSVWFSFWSLKTNVKELFKLGSLTYY